MKTLFHGGCHGCTMQEIKGIGGCVGCQYFEGDWSLPNLNDEYSREKKKLDEIREYAKLIKDL